MLLLHNESDLRPAIPELFMRLVLVLEFIRSASPLSIIVRCGQPNWPDH
jgi:hypothetical protein